MDLYEETIENPFFYSFQIQRSQSVIIVQKIIVKKLYVVNLVKSHLL